MKRERPCIWDEGRIKIRGGTRRVNTLPTGLPVQRKVSSLASSCTRSSPSSCLNSTTLNSARSTTPVQRQRGLSDLASSRTCSKPSSCTRSITINTARRTTPRRSQISSRTRTRNCRDDPRREAQSRTPTSTSNTRTVRPRKRATLSSPLTALGVTAERACTAAAVEKLARVKKAVGNFAFQSFENYPEETLPTTFSINPRRLTQRLLRTKRLHPILHSRGRHVTKDNTNLFRRQPRNNFRKMFPRNRGAGGGSSSIISLTRLHVQFILVFKLHHPLIFDNGIATTRLTSKSSSAPVEVPMSIDSSPLSSSTVLRYISSESV